MVISRSFGLVENLLDFQSSEPRRDFPFDYVSDTIADHGGAYRRQDRNLAFINIRLIWEIPVSRSSLCRYPDL